MVFPESDGCSREVIVFRIGLLIVAALESAARKGRDVRVDLLRGNAGVGESRGPKFDELLDDFLSLEIHVLGRMFAAEAPVEQRTITKVLAGLEILADHGLPAGNHTGKQLRPIERLETIQSLVDRAAQKGGSVLHLPHNHLA